MVPPYWGHHACFSGLFTFVTLSLHFGNAQLLDKRLLSATILLQITKKGALPNKKFFVYKLSSATLR